MTVKLDSVVFLIMTTTFHSTVKDVPRLVIQFVVRISTIFMKINVSVATYMKKRITHPKLLTILNAKRGFVIEYSIGARAKYHIYQ